MVGDFRVVDGLTGRVGFKVALGDIGLHRTAVDEDVIPGAVLGRPAFGDIVIPFRGAEKMGVDIDDHAPVIEKAVHDQVTGSEFRFGGAHGADYSILAASADAFLRARFMRPFRP